MGELFIIVMIGIFLAGAFINHPQPIAYPAPIEVKPKPKPKTKTKPTSKMSDVQAEAKKTLMQFGYTATEAKDLLKGLNCSTADQYVKEAMKRVKI